MLICTAEQMRAMDRYTIEEVGLPGRTLMELAGRGVAGAVAEGLGTVTGKQVLVLAGPGNNGGDGLVAARHLANQGADVTVALFTLPENLRGNPAENFQSLRMFPVRIRPVDSEEGLEGLFSQQWAAVVDALLGTGLSKPVRGLFAKAIDLANRTQAFKVAVDIPSGVNADTGAIMGNAFYADVSVTFGMAKIGHFSYPGRGFCGFVRVIDISIPRIAVEQAGVAGFTPEDWNVAAFLGPRDAQAFKNSFGHLLIIGGSRGKGGATVLAGLSALRSGAGLVTIATDTENSDVIAGMAPDLMVEGLYFWENGDLSFDKQRLSGLLDGKTAIAIGPGLGVSEGAIDLISAVLEAGLPMVIDADALNTIAKFQALPNLEGHVITPHPGEAARLLGVKTAEVRDNRIHAARRLKEAYRGVVVLKGAGTITLDEQLVLNTSGSPALAVAGSGDCLTGVIGGFLAQGMTAFDAAWTGVYVHGVAGELAGARLGVHGVTASDVSAALPAAIQEISGSNAND